MSNKLVCCCVVAIFANIAIAMEQISFILCSTAFICILVLFLLIKKIKLLFALMLVIVWVVFSFLRYNTEVLNVSDIPMSYNNEAINAVGIIHSTPERDGDRIQFEIIIKQLYHSESQLDLSEKVFVQLYLKEQSELELSREFSRGQTIKLIGMLKQPNTAQNYNQFDYRHYLSQKRIHWVLQIDNVHQIEKLSPPQQISDKLLYFFDRLRERLYTPFNLLFDEKHAGYLAGLVFGMKTELDPELFQSFSKLGLTHILAVSGMHVAVVVTCLLFIFKQMKLPRALAYNLTIAILPFYIILTGAEPSIIRAGIMGMIGLWLAKRQKLKNTLAILAIAALLMIAFDPLVIYSVGFQLSFLVTCGLLIYTPLIRKSISSKPNKLLDLIAVTLSAQLTSFPLTIYYFNTFNPLTFLANFVLVPYISFIILPLSTLTNIVGHLSYTAAKPLSIVTTYANELSFLVIDGLNKWDGMNLIWKSPALLWILLWYVIVFFMFNCLSQLQFIKATTRSMAHHSFTNKPIYIKIFLSSIMLCALILYGYYPERFSLYKEGSISYISVGQGDSILITTPSYKHILVDTGGQITFREKQQWAIRKNPFDVGKNIIVPILKKRGIKQLDIVVISHFDADHFQGLNAVLDEILVKQVWINGTIKDDAEVKQVLGKIIEKKIPILIAKQGDHHQLDKHTTITVLWPEPQNSVYEEKQNEESIVLLLEMFKSRFLLTGDIGKKSEQDITSYMYEKYGQAMPIDILKVPHHGSKYSSSPYLLSYFSPKLSVVSVGENNRYGHPHPDVINRVAQYNSPLLRTDIHGEIVFKINKNGTSYLNWNN